MASTLASLLHPKSSLKIFLPAAAIAAALAVGAPSAHAATGSLNFFDGLSDFFDDVPDAPVAGDMFSVTFNPGLQVGIQGSSGVFDPPFDGTPIYVENVNSASVASFTYTGASDLWTLNNTTSFGFTNGVTIGINEDVPFLVLKGASSVAVDIVGTAGGPAADVFVTGLPVGSVTPTAGVFTFNDDNGNVGGSYSANITVATPTVPGPLPLLGAGVAFGYSRKVRKRIKLSQTA